jgi:aspartate/methionine/tyrosine aminotransferase
MNFHDFQQQRDDILRQQPKVIDCAATNLYAALSFLIPPSGPEPTETVHRCHLAAEWGRHFGISSEESRFALVSSGVRESLSRLFRHYASVGAKLWLPSDNYPVYGQLARKMGFEPLEFATLPFLQIPRDATVEKPELLVLTNPLKPLGRWLTAEETRGLIDWLGASPDRRLILDTVYNLDSQFHSSTLDLLATRQTILLHSLTKGWLHPRLMGVALTPEVDSIVLKEHFRSQPPAQNHLAQARELLSQHPMLPAEVARRIEGAAQRMHSELPELFPEGLSDKAVGYFFPVSGRWSDLLQESGVLGLPAAVFGSRREDITILSSLNFLS